MQLSFAFTVLVITSCYGSRTNQVSRAIENTKRRQTPVVQQIRSTQQQRPGRTEDLDVDKLNQLIRSIDKTWVLPRSGAKEPVGSNFQYKKTCASIYKVRHGACQQIGFGVMCFNYCHEQGQKLTFRCQDTSDASYCRNSGSFDATLAKYRKDSYKAKTFIHQMISRCYATAICNLQTGLLNSTLVEEKHETLPTGPKPPSNQTLKLKTSTISPRSGTSIKPKSRALSRNKVSVPLTRVTQKPSKTNIWDRFTVNQKVKPTAKYIPFWQKLLLTTTAATTTTVTPSTTTTTTEESVTETSNEIEEEDSETEVNSEEKESETLITDGPVTNEVDEREEVLESVEQEQESKKKTISQQKMTSTTTFATITAKLSTSKRIIKQKENSTASAASISLPSILERKSMQTPKNEKGSEFWNRFQPGKWFQSIN